MTHDSNLTAICGNETICDYLKPILLILFVGSILFLLVGCATPGASSTPLSTQGAQTVGQDQTQTQGTETGSASNRMIPVLMMVNAAKSVKLTTGADGATTAEIEGSENAEVTISGQGFMNVNMRDDYRQDASISSGSAVGTGSQQARGNTPTPAPVTGTGDGGN